MSNEFSKEEKVAFDEVLEGFHDALILSKNISVYNTDQTTMERTGDTIWRPMPYIAQSYDGVDQTANFQSFTQLSVPATIGFAKSVPFLMDSKELRDALQEGRIANSAKQKLASDINLAVMNVAALQGTVVVARSAAATGYDDVAQADAVFNEQGVMNYDRYLALSSRDYNNMASNLAGRETMTGKPATAYEKSYVGTVAGFETYKLDYANRLTAAAGGAGLTINTTVAGAQFYTPVATTVSATGRSNTDNRYQTVTISSTTNVAAGDCFTIAGVNAVHHITKGDTGQLKTFRVISVDSATTMTISPPLITGQGGTDAELQYQNCVVNTAATNSSIVFLNTVTASVNPFWHKDAIELLPGRRVVNSGDGIAVMRASTEQGIEVIMTKQADINTHKTKIRFDVDFGVVNKQPEMTGIMLFGQT